MDICLQTRLSSGHRTVYDVSWEGEKMAKEIIARNGNLTLNCKRALQIIVQLNSDIDNTARDKGDKSPDFQSKSSLLGTLPPPNFSAPIPAC